MVLTIMWSGLGHSTILLWPFLSKIVSGLKKIEPITRSREENPNEGSDDDTGCIVEREPSNVDDIKAWDSANENLFRF